MAPGVVCGTLGEGGSPSVSVSSPVSLGRYLRKKRGYLGIRGGENEMVVDVVDVWEWLGEERGREGGDGQARGVRVKVGPSERFRREGGPLVSPFSLDKMNRCLPCLSKTKRLKKQWEKKQAVQRRPWTARLLQ